MTVLDKPHTPEQVVEAIKYSINEQQSFPSRKKAVENLTAVLNLLPEFSVVAVMEAEARCMDPEFINLLKRSFEVRSLT